MTTRSDALPAAHVLPAALSRWQAIIAPLSSGAMIAATWLDFSLWPLAWVAFVPLLLALDRAATRREALRIGWIAGLATNVPAFYWLVYTIHVFGGFPYPLALLFYVCLSFYSAVQFVLFAWGFHRLRFGPLGLAVPVLWVSLELLFPNLFPWRMANSQLQAPLLMQSGDLAGPYLLSFVMLWVSAGLARVLRAPRRPAALIVAGVGAALLLGYGMWRVPRVQQAIDSAPRVSVGLVQGNVGIREKGNVALFDINLDTYRQLSAPMQDVDVLIWPESVSQHWVPADADSVPTKHNPYPGTSAELIYGGLSYEYPEDGGEARMFNSAFLIDGAGGVHGRYDKQVLIPFGEYIPGGSLLPFLYDLSPQTSHFTPGARLATLDVPGKVRVAPLICYEDVPAGIARGMTAAGAEALLTIFNDAWFGNSMAPYQHEAIAIWRAIENRRYFMRVGNAGVTGVVDPFGRVLDRLGMFTAETLRADIRPLQLRTIYTRVGDLFGWTVVAVAAVWLVVRSRRAA
ncbi:MAG: apolipoprotein N-acyltransferase [Deltaproteobacteria bacterium]|nr:apolipoprotein N-acyltransferase [Deltaproteobacteria bacterium]